MNEQNEQNEQKLDIAIAEVFKELTPEERVYVKNIITIFNKRRNLDRAIDEVVKEMTPDEINHYKKWVEMKKSECYRCALAKINGVIVEHNSFLEPITSEMCRTSQSFPRKGYTSVSRIAKG